MTFICLGGQGKTEAVMSIATRLDMANYPAITVLTQQDLEAYFRKLHPLRPLPSSLKLIRFYIEQEQPVNVFADEIPMERSICRRVLTLWNWVIFAKYLFPLGLGISVATLLLHTLLATSVIGTIFALYNEDSLPILMTLIAILASWFLLGMVTSPFSLASTTSLLTKLPTHLPSPSGHIWLALHSLPLTDNVDEAYSVLSNKELDEWRRSLMSTYSVPCLKINLRNRHEVAKVKVKGSSALNFDERAQTLPAASPSPYLPTRSSISRQRPLMIKLQNEAHLQNALRKAYASMGNPQTLVVLLDNNFDEVGALLVKEGIDVVKYRLPSDKSKCEAFLRNPHGALITMPVLFSGMEAANVIWVRGDDMDMQRSNILRANDKLCVINTKTRCAEKPDAIFDVEILTSSENQFTV